MYGFATIYDSDFKMVTCAENTDYFAITHTDFILPLQSLGVVN